MNKNIYARNFAKLSKLLPNLARIKKPIKLAARGFADLHVELLERKKEHLDLLLSRHFERNFDQTFPDPDVAVRVYPKARRAKALTFRDIHDDHRHTGKRHADLHPQNLNRFLSFWLRNLDRYLVDIAHRLQRALAPPTAEQRFSLVVESEPPAA